MSDLLEFLTARLDEDEAAARAAASMGGPIWRVATVHRDETSSAAVLTHAGSMVADTHWTGDTQIAPFIAHHDPARVLREVAAKRAILGRHQLLPRPVIPPPGTVSMEQLAAILDVSSAWGADEVCACRDIWPCQDLLSLAAVYCDHPDYDPAWGSS